MSPPQVYEKPTVEQVPIEEQINITELAAKGWYFEFPTKKVDMCILRNITR